MTDETPQYELSINLQPMIDTMHKRGVVGETDLILQIAIGYMELKNPSRRFLTTDSYQQELDLGFLIADDRPAIF